MNKPIVVLWHRNCSDGFGAAWSAFRSLRGQEMEFIGVSYHEPIPEIIDKEIYIVDFCYSREVLLDLKSKNKSIMVLDHHITAKEQCEGLDFCTFDMNRSGAGLSWDHFHDLILGKPPRPLLIDLIEYRDLGYYWNNQTHKGKFKYVKELLAYVDSFDKTFDNWNQLAYELDWKLEEAIAQGQAILRYQQGHIVYLSKLTQKVMLDGKEYDAVNTPLYQSDVGNLLAQKNGVGVTWNQQRDGRIKFSLRGDDNNDVSKLAQVYGGGGHKKAAGFTIDGLVVSPRGVHIAVVKGGD